MSQPSTLIVKPVPQTSDGAHASPEPSRRRKHTNSRGGCQRCKARHEKCDETSPACHRCLNRGVECPGYIKPQPRKPRVLRNNGFRYFDGSKLASVKETKTVPPRSKLGAVSASSSPSSKSNRSPSLSPPLSPASYPLPQKHKVHEFLNFTVPCLNGVFSAETWTKSALQLCQNNGLVRTCCIAVVQAHEVLKETDGIASRTPIPSPSVTNTIAASPRAASLSPTSVSSSLKPTTTPAPFARRQKALDSYVIALRGLSSAMQARPLIEALPIRIANALLIIFEALIGSTPEGMSVHINSGAALMHLRPTDNAHEAERDHVQLDRLLCRLWIASAYRTDWQARDASALKAGATIMRTLSENESFEFRDLSDARSKAMWLVLSIFKFVTAARQGHFASMLDCMVAKWKIMKEYDASFAALDALMARLRGGDSNEMKAVSRAGYHAVSSALLVGVAQLRRTPSTRETAFDASVKDFAAVVEHIGISLALNAAQSDEERKQGNGVNSTFAVDQGLFNALWPAVCKCRHPTIRRRAAALIRKLPPLNGVFNGRLAGKVALMVFEFEERDVDVGMDPKQVMAGIQEENRIYMIEVGLGERAQGSTGGKGKGRRKPAEDIVVTFWTRNKVDEGSKAEGKPVSHERRIPYDPTLHVGENLSPRGGLPRV